MDKLLPPTATPPISWKTVLLLCIPGLLLGLILRVCFVSAIPEAYYGPDGGSYWHTAVRLWTEGNLSMVDKRRWLYPAFISALPIFPTSPIHTVAILQHLLGLMMVFLGGMITARSTSHPKIWVPIVAILLASWPQTLWLEHSLETETCFVAMFMVVVFIGLAPGDRLSARRLFWFLLAAALVAAWKPHGRGIWLACLLIALWRNGNPLQWARRSWGAIGFALVIIVSSGSSGQGNWLLLNSVLPLVPLDGPAYPAERAALQPLLSEARAVRANYAWEQENFKYRLNSTNPREVGERWVAVVKNGKNFSKICRTFAFEALRAEPVEFAKLTVQKMAISLSENGYSSRIEPKKFWHDQIEENAGRWKKNPLTEMALLYRLDATGYTQVAQNGAKKTNFAAPFIRKTAEGWGWFREKLMPSGNTVTLRITGWLALLGLAACCLPSNLKRFAILWLPALFYSLTVYAVGDRLGRYAYPLNWLGVILIVVGLDQALTFVRAKTNRFSSQARVGVSDQSAAPSSV